jgi:serine/threonine-protein kinase
MSRLGRDKESERLQREAISILRKVLPNHPKLATTLNSLGLILLARGDEIAAEPLFRESIEIRRARLNALHPDLAQTLNNLGFLLYSWGRLTEARPLLEEALKIRRKALGSNHPATLDSLGVRPGNNGQVTRANRESNPLDSVAEGRACCEIGGGN